MDAEVETCERFSLLASAISGRPLEVAPGDPGLPAWTDGHTVFVDAVETHQTQSQCVVVQASLLCVGSFEPDILHKLIRKPSATRRYLSLEGHRALTVLRDVLPATICPAPDPATAQRSDSPQSSLLLALGSEEVPNPPAAFGVIRPRLVGQIRDDRVEGVGPHTRLAPGKASTSERTRGRRRRWPGCRHSLESRRWGRSDRTTPQAASRRGEVIWDRCPRRGRPDSLRSEQQPCLAHGFADDGPHDCIGRWTSWRGARIRLPGVGCSPPPVSTPMVHRGRARAG